MNGGARPEAIERDGKYAVSVLFERISKGKAVPKPQEEEMRMTKDVPPSVCQWPARCFRCDSLSPRAFRIL